MTAQQIQALEYETYIHYVVEGTDIIFHQMKPKNCGKRSKLICKDNNIKERNGEMSLGSFSIFDDCGRCLRLGCLLSDWGIDVTETSIQLAELRINFHGYQYILLFKHGMAYLLDKNTKQMATADGKPLMMSSGNYWNTPVKEILGMMNDYMRGLSGIQLPMEALV